MKEQEEKYEAMKVGRGRTVKNPPPVVFDVTLVNLVHKPDFLSWCGAVET